MTDPQIAQLSLAALGGVGAIIVIAGIVARILMRRANDSCTARTTGTIVRHRFNGEGVMYPIVQYAVDGKRYQTKKRFRGVKTSQVSGLSAPMRSEAYEDERGWLHVKSGPVASMGDLAEQLLWPLGSEVTVHYDPAKPQRSYVDRPLSSTFACTMCTIMGLAIIAMGALVFFLMQL